MAVDHSVIPGHTQGVKVAISVPDRVCAAVDEAAARLGISRSEFFATAAGRYLEELQRASLTRSVDEAIALIGGDVPAAADRAWSDAAARRTFERNPW
jgi:hypothetical protein